MADVTSIVVRQVPVGTIRSIRVGFQGPPGAPGFQGSQGPGSIVATDVGGTANAITATAAGLGALSATPQLVWLIPVSTCTGPVTVDFNNLGAVDVVSPQGVALAAGEMLANTPTLLAVTSSSVRIFTTGAVW